MATTLGTLLLLIKGDTKDLKSKLSEADKSILSFAKNMTRMGNQLRSTGKQLTTELTLPLVGLAVAALKTAGNLEEFKAPLDGMRNSLRGAMADILRGALPALQGLAKAVSGVAKWFTDLGDGAKKTILVLAGIAAAIGPALTIAGRLVTVVGFLQRAFVAAKLAATAMNLALVANPWMAVAAAIGVLAVALVGLAAKQRAANEEARKTLELQEKLKQTFVDVAESYAQTVGRVKALSAEEREARRQALVALQRQLEWEQKVNGIDRERGEKLIAIKRELQQITLATVGVSAATKELTEEQKNLQAELAQIDQKALIYGDDLDVLAEKKRAVKAAIDDLVNKGFKAQSAEIQWIIRLYGNLLSAEEAQSAAVEKHTEALEIHTEALVEFASKVDPLAKASSARAAAYQAEVDLSLAAQNTVGESTLSLIDKLQGLGAMATEVFGTLSDLAGIMLQNRLAALDNEMSARRKAIESSITDETLRAKALEDLDTEFEDRRRELARRQAERSKKASVFQSILDTGNAVLAALASVKPTIPLGLLASIFVGALGLAKTAFLAATPIPALAEGGRFIVPPGYPDDSFPMRVESGERVEVTPVDQVRTEQPVLVERPLVLAVDTTPVYRGLLRATRDGIALVAQRSVVP